jgi:ferredoxin-NADP reductase
MSAYKVKLLSKQEVATGTIEFRFSKPEGFSYKPGQSVDLFLINPPETDAEGNKRAYSLSSSPFEEFLSITTRIRDTAFKRVLNALEMGAELDMDGPFGDMTLVSDATKPIIIFAGGIGITPFYSMVKQMAKDGLTHNIYLFYSNRTPQDGAYIKELSQIALEHTNLTFVPTITENTVPETEWADSRGYITKELVNQFITQTNDAWGYMAGPPAFTAAMRDIFHNLGVVDDYIKSEEFTGYK